MLTATPLRRPPTSNPRARPSTAGRPPLIGDDLDLDFATLAQPPRIPTPTPSVAEAVARIEFKLPG